MQQLKHISPKEFEEKILKAVKGQNDGIKTLSTVLSSHITRIIHNRLNPDNPVRKDGALLIAGPSGCGKTLSLQTALDGLPIPYAIISTNTLSNAGYKGNCVTDIFDSLIRSARSIVNKNPEEFMKLPEYLDEAHREKLMPKILKSLCENGIIVFDEADKIATNKNDDNQDAWFYTLQTELLKLSADDCSGFGESPLSQSIRTNDILFIFAGAFTNLLEPEPLSNIGFTNNNISTKPVSDISTETLCNYGIIPELANRLTVRTVFRKLSENDLFSIIKDSSASPVILYKTLINYTDNFLYFDDSALHAVAHKALKLGSEARGMNTILSEVMYPLLYSVDGNIRNKDITITEAVITDDAKPIIELHKSKKEKNQHEHHSNRS